MISRWARLRCNELRRSIGCALQYTTGRNPMLRLKLFALFFSLAAASGSYGRLLSYAIAFSLALTAGAMPAFAHVLIAVDKNTQQMSVSVDGMPRYQFAVSTGRAGFGTPNGTYHPQSMAATWFSKEYYNSPMPHSIFFHRGYAIHGSYEIDRLGGPASHGCIRLHPENATALYSLVQREGMAATTIVVYGDNPETMRSQAPMNQWNYNQWNYGVQPDRRMQQAPWSYPFFR
jgi:hypothetical protein